jgi:hypothetical protein
VSVNPEIVTAVPLPTAKIRLAAFPLIASSLAPRPSISRL